MSRLFVDSAYPPSAVQAANAKAQGVEAWGLYVGGSDAAHTWKQSDLVIVEHVGIAPMPIWVPAQDCSESAVQQAQQAIAACERLGIRGAVWLDTEESMAEHVGHGPLASWITMWCQTVQQAGWKSGVYAGAGYVPGNCDLPWYPLWGSTNEPSAYEAIQYGPGVMWGMSVDTNYAGSDFTFAAWEDQMTTTPPPEEGTLDAPIIDMAIHPTGQGAWLLGSDGGVFAIGVPFHGSLVGKTLDRPPVAIKSAPDGGGYYVLTSDGGVFTFGTAPFFGSLPGQGLKPAAEGPEEA